MSDKRTVILIGNKRIFDILSGAFKELNFNLFLYEGPSSLSKINPRDVQSIMDLSNNLDPDGVKEFLDYAVYLEARYIYGYRIEDKGLPTFKFIENLILDYVDYKNLKAVLLELGDLYGDDYIGSSVLREFILSMVSQKPLIIKNESKPHHLIHIEDFASSIMSLITDWNLIGRLGIKSNDPILELELAEFLKELSDIEHCIEYDSDTSEVIKDAKKLDKLLVEDEQINLNKEPSISLEEGLLELLYSHDIPTYIDKKVEEAEENIRLVQENLAMRAELTSSKGIKVKKDPNIYDLIKEYKEEAIKTDNPVIKKRKFNKSNIAKIISSLFLVIGLFFAIGYIGFYVFTLNKLVSNTEKSLSSFDKGAFAESIKYGDSAIENATYLENVPLVIDKGLSLLKAKESLRLFLDSAILVKNASLSILAFDNGKNNVLGVSTIRANLDSESLLYQYDIALKSSGMYKREVIDNKDLLSKNAPFISSIEEFTKIFNQVKKTDGKYIVVLQNTAIPRANGGLIYDMALVNIENGKFIYEKTINMDDINSILELNSSFVMAPEIISRSKKSPYLHVEDANWSPDFSDSAKVIMDMYEKSFGEDINGVLIVNNTWIVRSLGLSSDEKVESLNNFLIGGSLSLSSLMADAVRGFIDKDILFYTDKGDIQASLIDNNWSGGIPSYTGDYLYVLNSAVNSNEVKRSVEYIGYDPVNEKNYVRKVVLKYEALEDVNENVRVLVPVNTSLKYATLIDVDGVEKNITKDILTSTVSGNTVFDTDIYIAKGKQLSLELSYETHRNVLGGDNNLTLYVQKQPGENNPLFRISLYGGQYNEYVLDEDKEITIPLYQLLKR